MGFSARGVCDSSSGGKFWTVSVTGCEMTTNWGKVGSTGQTKVKDWGSEDKAVKEAEKLHKAKLKGGYVMEEQNAGGKAAPKAKPAPKTKKATVKAPPKRKEETKPPPNAEDTASLAGKLIVFTGTLQMKRAEAKALAEENGAKVGSTVTGKTDILIAAADAGAAKTAAAEAKGVKVWSEEQFVEMCQEGAQEEPTPAPPAKATKAKAGAKRKAEAAPGAAAKKAKAASVGFSARGVCDSSSGGKFWTVSVTGCEMTTNWGKVGSTGQTKVKDCGSEDKAVKEAEKLHKAKLKGGYVMEDDGDGDAEESDAPAALALYLKDERAFDGTFNNEEGVEAHILSYQDQLVGDSEAADVAQQLEVLEGISINNGSEADFQWEVAVGACTEIARLSAVWQPLVIAPANGKAKLSADLHGALHMKKSAGAKISPLADFKKRVHFWRSSSYDDIETEIEEFNECDSSWASKAAAATKLLQSELKDCFEMTFKDSVVVAPIMVGGYTKAGNIVAVMGTRVYT